MVVSSIYPLTFGVIEGVTVSPAFEFNDRRGTLFKPYGSSHCNDFIIRELFFTVSNKNVFRGMHLQVAKHQTNKIISVVSGSVLDFTIDIRENSPTFLKVSKTQLSDSKRESLFVPAGVAHGYHVLEENTSIMYLYDNEFCANCDVGFHFKSIDQAGSFNINPIVSAKDSVLPELDLFLKKITTLDVSTCNSVI